MTHRRTEPQHIARYRYEFAKKPDQCWYSPSAADYRRHRRARRRAATLELRKELEELCLK